MAPPLIFAGILIPLFGLVAWSQKRLRDEVAKRHPSAYYAIDCMIRSASRSSRMFNRVSRYKMLQDPEIDRHIRNLRRVENAFGWSILAFFTLGLTLMAVSAAYR